MSLAAQAKVLRALQESRITRVGGDRSIPVNVRVVAATNKDLLAAVEAGAFREDLYHRLAVLLIHVPPLRERRADVPIIARAIAERMGKRSAMLARTFADDALAALSRLDWRGNVRELHNVVERLLILSEGETVTARDVERYVGAGAATPGANPVASLLDQYDDFTAYRDRAVELFLLHQLEKHGWNVSRTAETIGIQRSHLYNMMGKYEIERGSEG